MADREVTERDFRRPEFEHADPKDYEFRDDGKIVRKDRWRVGIFRIASEFGFCSRAGFEVAEVVAMAEEMADRRWFKVDEEDYPKPDGTYIGVNSAGFVGAFNEIDDDGVCWMVTPEGPLKVLSDLVWWRKHIGPPAASGAQPGEGK